MAPRPSEFPRWATGGTAEVTEPSEEEKDAGHIPQTILHAALANWLQKLVYDWLLYLDGDRVSLTDTVTPTQAKPGTAAVVGVVAEAARADHVHDVPSGPPAALTVGGAQVVGGATTVSRSDHVHAMPGVATTTTAGFFAAADKVRLDSIATDAAALTISAPTQITVTAAVSGGGTTAARSDHVHSVSTAAPATLAVGGTNVVGGSASLARADHVHATPSAGTPVALTLAGTNAAGGAATVALSDHVHALPGTAAAAVLAVGGASSIGLAATLSRSDHLHGMPGVATIGADGFMSVADKVRLDSMATSAAALTSTAPTQISVTTAALGGDTAAARGDHVHSVSTAAPVALTVGGSNLLGGAASLARSDHSHGLPAFGATAGTIAQGSDARLSDDRVGSGLRTATTVVAVSSAAAPAAGAVLTASSGTAAAWVSPLALSGNTPANVAASGSSGGSTAAAHSDHVHAHGDHAGGTLHATATTTVAGFLSAVDKVRLDGMASGSAALGDTVAVVVDAATGAQGIGSAASRIDHRHQVSVGTPATLGVGGTNTAGGSNALARADHLHALPPLATTAVNGFFAATDKVRLDGIETGAQVTSFARVQTALAAASSAVAFNGQRLTGVASPTADTDAYTRGYAKAAWPLKAPVRAASTATIAFATTAPNVVDGVTLALNDRVLVKNGGDGNVWEKNGIYTVQVLGTGSNGTWVRASDADSSDKLQTGTRVFVLEGTANAGRTYEVVSATQAHTPIDGGVAVNFQLVMSPADKTKLDGIEAGAQVTSFARVQTALGAASSAVSFNAQKLTNVADPTSNQEAATKAYVDARDLVADWKDAARWVAISNVSLTGLTGSAVAGDRVLCVAQTDGTQNGLWVAASGAWARAADAASSAQVTLGMACYVSAGGYASTAQVGYRGIWVLSAASANPIVLGTSTLTFTEQRTPLIQLATTTPQPGECAYSDGSAPITLPNSTRVGSVIGLIVDAEGVEVIAPSVTGAVSPIDGQNIVGSPASVNIPGHAYVEWVLTFDPGDADYTWEPRACPGIVWPSKLGAAMLEAGGLAMGGTLDMTGNPISQLGTPSADTDAANKQYVDAAYRAAAPRVNQCRLSGDAAAPVMTADNAAISTIYLLPYVGDVISLYVAAVSAWVPFAIPSAGILLALSGLTTGRPHDVFAVAPAAVGGTPTLTTLAWGSTTARTTGLVLQNGVYVKSGTPAQRYLGTIYARSATTISFVQQGNDATAAKCDIWNVDNQVRTPFRYARSWTPETFTHPTANTWVGANGAASRVELVQGLAGSWTRADAMAAVQTKTFVAVTAVGIDTVSTPSGFRTRALTTNTNDIVTTNGQFSLQVPIGSHYLAWIIWASNVAVTWWGAQSTHESGLIVEFMC